MPLTCPLRFFTLEPCPRRGEPVTVGLPWPRGAVTDERRFRLIGPDGSSQPLQSNVLDRWPDGSVRWCLFDFLATWDGRSNETGYRIEFETLARPDPPSLDRELPGPLHVVAEYDAKTHLILFGPSGVVETGAIRRRSRFTISQIGPCRAFGHIDEFAGAPTLRIQFALCNPQPADHPGGNWDLGNGGSFYLQSLRFAFALPNESGGHASWERGKPSEPFDVPIEIRQHSSGGKNWNSSNHLDRNSRVGIMTNGYEVVSTRPAAGLRATPIITVGDETNFLGLVATPYWENFPKRLGVTAEQLFFDLFPTETELQGGEQKTHTFYVAFGKDTITDEPMVWCRSPIVCSADPEWYAASGAIPYLTPKATDPYAKYLALVDQAIEGPDTFVHKREKIDEYGWRHFGDIYGDHEAVYHKGETPLISHYNNQYDCVAAFLIQFFRSGDLRWLTQGLECADHTCDIDIYHTDGDKAAYSHGLFWHTYHYADAGTGNHRSYPKALTRGPVESLTQKMDQLGKTAQHLKKSYAVGGGPASSNNYNIGLMLSYFLTGNPLYREGALELADYALSIEDPKKTPFRFLSREFTGLASESGGGAYHGPGRGPANSILAVLVGHQLTGDLKYLTKAEQLIRRVVHPKQNLERLDLLNAELRWFYTMTLQAIGRYLDYKIELGQLDEHYAYARLTLLHYARWMAANERPILDTPEKLQYPTETWAAQDVRKVEVFQYAAKHATGEEKAKFLERAAWFFEYVQNKLSEFETKSLTRPVILMMKYGWSRNWWRLNPTATAPEPIARVTADDFGEWRMFVPQKVKAIKRAKMIVMAGMMIGLASTVGIVWWLLNR